MRWYALLVAAALPATAIELVESYVSAMHASRRQAAAPSARRHPDAKQDVMTLLSGGQKICPFTGDLPHSRSDVESDAVCGEWVQSVCCTDHQLSQLGALMGYVRQQLSSCPGCVLNAEAALCAAACSPSVAQSGRDPGSWILAYPAEFCSALTASCNSSHPAGVQVPSCSSPQFFEEPLFHIAAPGEFKSVQVQSRPDISTSQAVEPVSRTCSAQDATGGSGAPEMNRGGTTKARMALFMIWAVGGSLGTSLVLLIALCGPAMLASDLEARQKSEMKNAATVPRLYEVEEGWSERKPTRVDYQHRLSACRL
mmetsp:Transcript_25828/g.56995  ORF Transcript_25828/g.56995 Transcript_25828/m.56995 type:complete len:312 (-) Transcript_25828:29-964(-)|eukprot:CAMPEP_0204388694 /NCGR_PEP_ID=MMETSP0469-20131031/59671_1 /ASSEMBLY_ACC=CAM_ASM_000384 /TAXON_ID=2969 /ORGANISM="Oxyrrhis marina" /LENGTH=311 /DNA_ID=CAMNT_0051382259 /DNA_START=154 /DNA_END=1089 /DNA_ORIENTATION=+